MNYNLPTMIRDLEHGHLCAPDPCRSKEKNSCACAWIAETLKEQSSKLESAVKAERDRWIQRAVAEGGIRDRNTNALRWAIKHGYHQQALQALTDDDKWDDLVGEYEDAPDKQPSDEHWAKLRTALEEADDLKSRLDEQQKNWERDLDAARRELDRAGEAATAALVRERNELQSRLSSCLDLAREALRANNPNPLLSRIALVAEGSAGVVENLPTWCPKCNAVMAHVPHECGVVEKPAPIARGVTVTTVDAFDSAQDLCNCDAAKGERHQDGCNTLSRLAQLGML